MKPCPTRKDLRLAGPRALDTEPAVPKFSPNRMSWFLKTAQQELKLENKAMEMALWLHMLARASRVESLETTG